MGAEVDPVAPLTFGNIEESTLTIEPYSASGHPCIPAAIALGTAFLSPRRQRLIWNQFTRGKTTEWSLGESSSVSGFLVAKEPADMSGKDMAVLLVGGFVRAASILTIGAKPRFRCILNVHREGKYPHTIATGRRSMRPQPLSLDAHQGGQTRVQDRSHTPLSCCAGWYRSYDRPTP